MNIILCEYGKIDTYKIKEFLEAQESISLTCARSWAEVASLMELYSSDLVLLTDFESCDVESMFKELHEARSKIATIVLLPEDTSKERSIGLLNLRADDVLIAPYNHEELLAKIFSIIRRSKGFESSEIQVGSLTIFPNTGSVKAGDKPLLLTKKEYMIFESLVMRKGEVSTKAMLLDRLYGGIDEPGERIVDAFIWHLRKKIKEIGIQEPYIETVWGQGYRIALHLFNNYKESLYDD